MKKLCIIFILAIFISSCSDEKPDVSLSAGRSPQTMFNQASQLVKDGDVQDGITLFNRLQAAYPSSKYAKQATLEKAYAYYQNEDFDDAISTANDYISEHPNDEGTVYAYFLRATSSEAKSKSFFTEYITDPALLDTNSTSMAFEYYSQLIEKFPNSHYAIRSKKTLIRLRNALARRELYTAIFYVQRQAHIAAVNRAKYIIEVYPTSPSIPAALVILERSYTEMGLNDLAYDAKRVRQANYPKYEATF